MLRLGKKLLIFSLVIAGFGVALADGPDAGPPAPDAGPEKRAAEEPPPPAPAPVVSVADMQKTVSTVFATLQDVMKRMVELQDAAKKEKDVIKLNCVADKMAQLKELTAIAEQARTNLSEAVTRGDAEAQAHELNRIQLAGEQAQVFGADAEGCIGEDMSFIGPTQVVAFEPPAIDDPTVPVVPDFPAVEPLPVASPQR